MPGTDDKSIEIGRLVRSSAHALGGRRARWSLQMKQLPALGAVVVRPLHPINREQDATVGAINILSYGLRPLEEAYDSACDSAYESTKDQSDFRVNLIADERTDASAHKHKYVHHCVGERGLLLVGSAPWTDIADDGDFFSAI